MEKMYCALRKNLMSRLAYFSRQIQILSVNGKIPKLKRIARHISLYFLFEYLSFSICFIFLRALNRVSKLRVQKSTAVIYDIIFSPYHTTSKKRPIALVCE